MGMCDIVTDILLIAFPIPVVLQSGQSWKRKAQMIILFSLSIIMIGVTATRMPQVISHQGRQQYRTVWASGEILASVSVSNGVILGSFLRDKGTKKNKYRNHSFSESLERTATRRPTLSTLHSGESEEDLFRSVGIRMPAYLQSDKSLVSPRPAPPALPAKHSPRHGKHGDSRHEEGERSSDSDSSMHKSNAPEALPSPSLFDVGNLLESNHQSRPDEQSYFPATLSSGTSTMDFAMASPSPHARSGSRTFLRDVGGVLTGREGTASPRRHRSRNRSRTKSDSAPIGVLGPRPERHETQVSLQDAGGLLHPQAANHPPSAHNLQAPQEDIELDDMGDFLQDERQRSHRGAVSLQEILGGTRNNRPGSAPPAQQVQGDFDDMILHDPGGLMS